MASQSMLDYHCMVVHTPIKDTDKGKGITIFHPNIFVQLGGAGIGALRS